MTEPISLLDLRRKTKVHALNGGEHSVEIRGLTAREICDHLERFAVLRTISIGGQMTPIEAITSTPEAAAAWVASACGQHRDPEAEQAAADNLTLDEASEIIEASLGLTFSKGFGPFSGRLAALLGYITVAPTKGPDTKSPPPSSPAGPQPTTESGTSPPDSLPPNAISISEISTFPPPPSYTPPS
jgi:hypothetical protein